MAGSEQVDLELIAALIDGRLSGEERQRALRLLAESEAAFEVYSDAVRARGDVVDRDVLPLAPVRGRLSRVPWRTIGPLAAAAVVLIAILPVMQQRRDRAILDATSAELVQPWIESPVVAATLTGAWDARGWSLTRGGNSRVVDSTVAFRLGVHAVDLQVALRQRDTAGARSIAGTILESLDAVELSDAVKADYRALREGVERGDPANRLVGDATRAETALDGLLQSFWYAFGRWIEAGDLAARMQSEPFFANDETARFLELAGTRDELAPADAALLREIAGLTRDGVTGEEFEMIRRNFATLIDRHGR